ncbi:MAG: hypothetical protein ABR925_04925 [Acidimicrobiales bacterium]|jgi:hypothetical protein
MGLMDKVKAQASVLAEKAQEGAKAGQAKLSDLQAKRHADSLVFEMGGIAYFQQTGRAPANADARISELVVELRQYEAEHGPLTVTPAPAAGAPSSDPAPAPTTDMPQSSGGIPTGTYSSDTEES